MMFRLIALFGILVVAAGCGGSNSGPKPTPTPKPAPTPVPTSHTSVPPIKGIIFGTSIAGGSVHGAASQFDNPSDLVWIAYLLPTTSSGSTTETFMRLNGPGTHPRIVWTTTITVPKGATTIQGQLTKTELKQHQITAGGNYSLAYTTKTGQIASGAFKMATAQTGPGGGY